MIIRRRSTAKASVAHSMLEDDRLSLDTKGLLAFLLSRPANWQVVHHELRSYLKVGRDRFQRMLDEALDAGYLQRDLEQPRDELSRFSGYNYVIDDCPTVTIRDVA